MKQIAYLALVLISSFLAHTLFSFELFIDNAESTSKVPYFRFLYNII